MKYTRYLLLIVLLFNNNQMYAGLVAGTNIATNGQSVAIENLLRGDFVVGYDLKTQVYPVIAVTAVQLHRAVVTYAIATDRGVIVVTADQLLFDVVGKKFVTADQWSTMCIFLTKDMQQLPTREIKIDSAVAADCYDVSLEQPYLFFASDAQVLMHNNPLVLAVPLTLAAVELAPQLINLCMMLENAHSKAAVAVRRAQALTQPVVPTPILSEQVAKQPAQQMRIVQVSQATSQKNNQSIPRHEVQAVQPILSVAKSSKSNELFVSQPTQGYKFSDEAVQRAKSIDVKLLQNPIMYNDRHSEISVTGSINGDVVCSNESQSRGYLHINLNTERNNERVQEARDRDRWARRSGKRLIIKGNQHYFTPAWFLENAQALAEQTGMSLDDVLFTNFENFQYPNYLQVLHHRRNYDQKILELRDLLRQEEKGWFSSTTEGKKLNRRFCSGEGFKFFHGSDEVKLSELIERLAKKVEARQEDEHKKYLAWQAKQAEEAEVARQQALFAERIVRAKSCYNRVIAEQQLEVAAHSGLYEKYEEIVVHGRLYRSIDEPKAFSHVFKSVQNNDYSESYKKFLADRNMPILRQSRNDAAKAIDEIIREMYQADQHFGYLYDVVHAHSIALRLISVADRAEQYNDSPMMSAATAQLLEAARGFVRSAEQLGEYYVTSNMAAHHTTTTINHLIHKVLIPLERHAATVAGNKVSLPQELARSTVCPVTVLANLYKNPENKELAQQCKAVLADLLAEEEFIVQAAAKGSVQVPTETPLVKLATQAGNLGSCTAAQAPPYIPSATMARGRQKEFFRKVSISSNQGDREDISPEAFVNGAIIDCAHKHKESFEDKRQAVISDIKEYEKTLFDLTPRSVSIDEAAAQQLQNHAPSWITATMTGNGQVAVAAHCYRLASYDASTRAWHFIVDADEPALYDRMVPYVHEFVKAEEKRELDELRKLTAFWPQEIRYAFKIGWPVRKDQPQENSGKRIWQAQAAGIRHGNLARIFGEYSYSFQALDFMLANNLAPSRIVHILRNGEYPKAHRSDRELRSLDGIVVVFEKDTKTICGIGTINELDLLNEYPSRKTHQCIPDQEPASSSGVCLPEKNAEESSCGGSCDNTDTTNTHGLCGSSYNKEHEFPSSSPNEGLPEPETKPCAWSQQPQLPGFDEDGVVEVLADGSNQVLPETTSSEGDDGKIIYKHGFKYHPRIRQRGLQDPKAHNFPYSFDDIILKTNPIKQKDGSLLYILEGILNEKRGVFEIAINTETKTIFHRTFRGSKK